MQDLSSEAVMVFWTSPSLEEARRVSRYLVKEHLVVCANIIPWVESVFEWNGQLETQQETKVIFKTKAAHFDAIAEQIRLNSQYEVPEINMVRIEQSNAAYLQWMSETLNLAGKE